MDVSGLLHTPATLTLGKQPMISMVKEWVGTTAGLDIMKKIKFVAPYQKSNPDSVQAVVQLLY
jgi:hypothetical protein